MANEQIRKTLRAYQRAVTAEPTNVDLREKLARYLAALGYTRQAVQELELCAKLLAAQGQLVRAISCGKRLLAIDPTRTDILLFLTRHYAKRPDSEEERVARPVDARVDRDRTPPVPSPPAQPEEGSDDDDAHTASTRDDPPAGLVVLREIERRQRARERANRAPGNAHRTDAEDPSRAATRVVRMPVRDPNLDSIELTVVSLGDEPDDDLVTSEGVRHDVDMSTRASEATDRRERDDARGDARSGEERTAARTDEATAAPETTAHDIDGERQESTDAPSARANAGASPPDPDHGARNVELPDTAPTRPVDAPHVVRVEIPNALPLDIHHSTLPKFALFSSLDPEPFKELLEGLEHRVLEPGTVIEAGSEEFGEAPALKILVRGRLSAFWHGHEDTERHEVALGPIAPGSVFGEFELLTGDHHEHLQLVATDETEVLVLPHSRFEALAERYPGLRRRLVGLHEKRVVRDFLASSPLFASLAVADRELLARKLETRTLRRGEVLGEPGDPVEGLYLVREGCLESAEGPEKTMREYLPGDVIGIHSLVEDGCFITRLRAVEPTAVLVLARPDLDAFLEAHPDARDAFDALARETL